jgi:hypothetical protein
MLSYFIFALTTALSALATHVPRDQTVSSCEPSSWGTFKIKTVNQPNARRNVKTRQFTGALTLTLQNGILKDQAGRQGYIAANHQ